MSTAETWCSERKCSCTCFTVFEVKPVFDATESAFDRVLELLGRAVEEFRLGNNTASVSPMLIIKWLWLRFVNYFRHS